MRVGGRAGFYALSFLHSWVATLRNGEQFVLDSSYLREATGFSKTGGMLTLHATNEVSETEDFECTSYSSPVDSTIGE